MKTVITIMQILSGLGVVGLVLLQQGKGADMGAAFGSGSAGSIFGAQGSANFLSRTTAILAILFFLSTLGLTLLNSKKISTSAVGVLGQTNSSVPIQKTPASSVPDKNPSVPK